MRRGPASGSPTQVATIVITDDGRVVAGAVPGRCWSTRWTGEVTTARTSATVPQASHAGCRRAPRGLRKVYRGTVAVDGVDLEVPEGAVVGMLGPNGSGKTTTIRMLLGLVQPTEGEIELLGVPVPGSADQVLPHVGALVEGPGFHPFLSGRENLLRFAAAEPLLAGGDLERRWRPRWSG